MTIEQIVHILGITSWIILAGITFPGLVRLFRNKAHELDPLKAALFFVAFTQLDVFFTRASYGASLWQFRDVFWWTTSGAVLTLAVFTLIVILVKTEKALTPTE